MEGAVWLSQTCGAQGQREQSGALVGGPPKVAQSLARGWLCSRARMSKSAFSR